MYKFIYAPDIDEGAAGTILLFPAVALTDGAGDGDGDGDGTGDGDGDGTGDGTGVGVTVGIGIAVGDGGSTAVGGTSVDGKEP